VDRKQIPGSYFLTGSSSFSSKLGIRESLTGRIGLIELLPLTLAELHEKSFLPRKLPLSNSSTEPPRFDSDSVIQTAQRGGMPVPCFLRDLEQRNFYWRSWLETSILRDLSRFFTRNYDPDFAFNLLDKIGGLLREGDLPTLRHFDYPARKVRTYFAAMEEIFLLRRVSCHPQGIGKEVWLLMDSGLAAYLMGKDTGEAYSLSLVRHLLWNEWFSQSEYQGKKMTRNYFKSAQGSPVDAILEGTPIKIVATAGAASSRFKVEERAVLGAMKKLESKFGYLVAPVSSVTLPPKSGGVGILPWGFWS
jgi:predicted AAA+ superfamily ATPase